MLPSITATVSCRTNERTSRAFSFSRNKNKVPQRTEHVAQEKRFCNRECGISTNSYHNCYGCSTPTQVEAAGANVSPVGVVFCFQELNQATLTRFMPIVFGLAASERTLHDWSHHDEWKLLMQAFLLSLLRGLGHMGANPSC